MKKNMFAYLLIYFSFAFACLLGDRAPQDSWYLEAEKKFPQMPGFRGPFGLDIVNGKSYVIDRTNHAVSIWDENGTFLNRFGTYGTEPGKFNNPRDLAVEGNEIFITDENNHRIQVFDLEGNYLRNWGTHGTNPGQFKNPHSIYVDSNATGGTEVYVSDWQNHKIHVFDTNGTLLRDFGEFGSGNHQIYHASGVTKGPDGLIYVSNYAYSRINVYETNGTFIRNFNTGDSPYDLDFFGDNLAVVHPHAHKTKIFDKNGTLLTTIGNGASSNPGLHYNNYGLSFDQSGDLHVTDSQVDRVQIFELNGTYKGSYGFRGSTNFSPYAIDVTPESTFLVTDAADDRVLEFDSNLSFVRLITSKGNEEGKVDWARSVHLGTDNRIYVADSSRHKVMIFDRNGSFILEFGEYGSGDGYFSQPYDAITSENGEIFVADRGNHRIQVFDANGTFLRKFGSSGSLEGQFRYPLSLDFSDEGNLMVGDHDNRRIVHFTKSGEFLRHYGTQHHPTFIHNLPNGLTGLSYSNRFEIYDENGYQVKFWNKSGGSHAGLASLPDGTIIGLDYDLDSLLIYRSTYRTIRPPNSKEIPYPEVISVVQPDNSNNLEITYRINDTDSPKVNAKMLAFVDGGNQLSKVIVPQSFVGSIAGKLDGNVSTNQNHTVVWNVGADWSVGFGELEVAILAKDDRDLLNLHFLTLPATDDNQTELVINRSPITDNDLLGVWYWLLASGDPDIVFSAANASISKPAPQSNGSSFSPSDLSSLALWLDANDSQSFTITENVVSQWNDKSGNDRHAQKQSGSPTLETGGINGLPFLSIRSASEGEEAMYVSGTNFFAKHMFFLCRSPHQTWRGYGAALGHQSGRNSNFLFQNGQTNFHDYRLPQKVWKNGLALSSSNRFEMSVISDFMILEVVVDDYGTSPKNNYYVGRSDNYSQDLDISEILAFDQELETTREQVLLYLSQKSNLAISGTTLVSGDDTTGAGRKFILDKMNLRKANDSEVARAKGGAIPSTINTFTPSLRVGPDERPNRVNEYGFDTGSNNGFWATPK